MHIKACCVCAGISLTVATLCNLASPVVTGILFEILTGGQPFSQYPKFLAVLGTLYIVEPVFTRIYIKNACAAGEKVCVGPFLQVQPSLLRYCHTVWCNIASVSAWLPVLSVHPHQCTGFLAHTVQPTCIISVQLHGAHPLSSHNMSGQMYSLLYRSWRRCALSFFAHCCYRRWSSLTGTTPQS